MQRLTEDEKNGIINLLGRPTQSIQDGTKSPHALIMDDIFELYSSRFTRTEFDSIIEETKKTTAIRGSEN